MKNAKSGGETLEIRVTGIKNRLGESATKKCKESTIKTRFDWFAPSVSLYATAGDMYLGDVTINFFIVADPNEHICEVSALLFTGNDFVAKSQVKLNDPRQV